MQPKYKRILIKLSGEALAGDAKFGLDMPTVDNICRSIRDCADLGVQIGVVVGGGNFWRGRTGGDMDRTRADHMGMLGTVINALALGDALERAGLEVRVQTAIAMQEIAEPYIRNRAVRHLEKGRVVVFGCGNGSPFFSTDTTAALRASEVGAEVILKATKVDGIYTADPAKDPTATKYDRITYAEALTKRLAVMDSTAFSLCMDNKVPIIVFDMMQDNNIRRVVMGENIGTLVS